MTVFEVTVNWHNPKEKCNELRRLDLKFNTTQASPLHHDNRCELAHNPAPMFEVVREVSVQECLDLLEPVGSF
jgi:hypothetical protein